MKAIEILTTVKTKLIEQGRPSIFVDKFDETPQCVYNSESGKHCGIGWLAPGAGFVEGKAVIHRTGGKCVPNHNTEVLLDARIISDAQFGNEDFRRFLADVQSAHDDTCDRPVTEFEGRITEALDKLIPRAEQLDKELS